MWARLGWSAVPVNFNFTFEVWGRGNLEMCMYVLILVRRPGSWPAQEENKSAVSVHTYVRAFDQFVRLWAVYVPLQRDEYT